eukprot:TRINITY_DN16763_c0_g3_i1.p1 TRINITY_DN16763_c0_g3~~TRINITY_DN16763_c0_g3_i1.p1  ORF type:complete len:381 (-),score=44.54 TRINITY_DN16763_c0_g3_i1:105-1181(-)
MAAGRRHGGARRRAAAAIVAGGAGLVLLAACLQLAASATSFLASSAFPSSATPRRAVAVAGGHHFAGDGHVALRGLPARAAAAAATHRDAPPLPAEFQLAPSQQQGGLFPLLRCIFFATWLLGITSMCTLVMALMLPWVRRRDPIRRRFMDRVNALWAVLSSKPFFRVEVLNRENLPGEDEACVYIANHQSFLDIFSMNFLRRPFKWVSKASILKIPVIGWAMAMTGHVALQRNDRRSQLRVVKDCVAKLRGGASMFFFPEGTRSSSGVIGPFKRGAISIARRANVGLAPITVLGTGVLMPPGKESMLHSTRAGVRLVCHPVIPAEEVQRCSDEELVSRCRKIIASELPPTMQGDAMA